METRTTISEEELLLVLLLGDGEAKYKLVQNVCASRVRLDATQLKNFFIDQLNCYFLESRPRQPRSYLALEYLCCHLQSQSLHASFFSDGQVQEALKKFFTSAYLYTKQEEASEAGFKATMIRTLTFLASRLEDQDFKLKLSLKLARDQERLEKIYQKKRRYNQKFYARYWNQMFLLKTLISADKSLGPKKLNQPLSLSADFNFNLLGQLGNRFRKFFLRLKLLGQ